MSPLSKNTVGHFVYDPLDRYIGVNATLLFYNQTRLATEIEGERKSCLFEYDAQPLALQQDGATSTLLATDMQTSVLHSVSADGTQEAHAYTPFGHQSGLKTLPGVSAFNGERPDPVTGHYLLGQGYRAYNPVLMRFNSTDSLSPFGEGGINAYAYCNNDPTNKVDPTGHIPNIWKALKNVFGRIPRRLRTNASNVATMPPQSSQIAQESNPLYPNIISKINYDIEEYNVFLPTPKVDNLPSHPPAYTRGTFAPEASLAAHTQPPPSYKSATQLISYKDASKVPAPARTERVWKGYPEFAPRFMPSTMSSRRRGIFMQHTMRDFHIQNGFLRRG